MVEDGAQLAATEVSEPVVADPPAGRPEPVRSDSTRPVLLGDRFEIQTDAPTSGLDTLAGSAFAAASLTGRKSASYALVLSGRVPPRHELPNSFVNIDPTHVTRLIDWGVVHWPGDRRRLALVFDRPAGRPLMVHAGDKIEPWTEEALTRAVIRPVLSGLKDLSGRGIVHGSIVPWRLFCRDQAGGTALLGECLSMPPGYGLPLAYTTIERGMAQPSGRGTGTVLDDLYALGVTLLVLALGGDPTADQDDETVLQAKMDKGSYPALVGSKRVPNGLIEPLRGLLSDDPTQRWALPQLDLWLSGRRLSPKQPQLSKRAARSIPFGGQEYWTSRGLARALLQASSTAVTTIESGDLDRWLRRSLTADDLADAVNAAIEATQGSKGVTLADRMVGRACIALDPLAPIRFKGRSFMLDGLSYSLAEAFLRRESYQALAEALALQLPMFWASAQTDFKAEYVPLVQMLDQFRGHLESIAPAYGIERVLYEGNRCMPCMSPMLETFYALSPVDVLLALDSLGATKPRPSDPIDRHILAFLSVRHRRLDDALYGQFAANAVPARRVVAAMTLLSDVQAQQNAPATPALCQWLASLAKPAVSRFHNRRYRDHVHKELEAVAKGGKIAKMLALLDDPEAIRRDAADFQKARREHRDIVAEIDQLRRRVADRTGIAETTGRQVAAVCSAVATTVVAAALILRHVLTP